MLPDGSIVERFLNHEPTKRSREDHSMRLQKTAHMDPSLTPTDPTLESARAAALAAFRKADSDGNGVLSFDEFERAFRMQFQGNARTISASLPSSGRSPHIPPLNLSKVGAVYQNGSSDNSHEAALQSASQSAGALLKVPCLL